MDTKQTEIDKRRIETMMRRIEVFKQSTSPPQWRFRIIADNGEIIAQSEGYYNRGDCYRTVNTYFPSWEIDEVLVDVADR